MEAWKYYCITVFIYVAHLFFCNHTTNPQHGLFLFCTDAAWSRAETIKSVKSKITNLMNRKIVSMWVKYTWRFKLNLYSIFLCFPPNHMYTSKLWFIFFSLFIEILFVLSIIPGLRMPSVQLDILSLTHIYVHTCMLRCVVILQVEKTNKHIQTQ